MDLPIWTLDDDPPRSGKATRPRSLLGRLRAPDQTWTALSGNAVVALDVAYEESAADSGRIPLTNHVFSVTPDGSDVTAQFNAAGFGRAA